MKINEMNAMTDEQTLDPKFVEEILEESQIELAEAIARQQDDAQHFEEMDEQEVKDVQEAVSRAQLEEMVVKLAAEVEKLKTQPKNQRAGKANDKNHYKLLTRVLEPWGNVPQQQKDIAAILAGSMEVGKEYTETEVFAMLIDGAGEFPSITRSKQDVTYLFRYYRGLKKDAKYAGFAARNFLRLV